MIRVLVVDDNDAFRQTVCDMLADGVFEILNVATAAEAMAVLRDRPMDIVLTDIVMPEKDGMEIIREIRKRKPALKIVAMSGGGRIAARDYLIPARIIGASATIEKPFKRQELIDLLQRVFPLPLHG